MACRHTLIGLGGLLALGAAVALCVASYARVFVTSVPVTLHADRSGLLMDPGAAVKLNGVVVGRVTSVRTEGDGARLGLGLDPDLAAEVPADVSARIVPPTLFGAKYVALDAGAPGPPGTPPAIAAGAQLDRSRVEVELNDTFEHTVQTLDAMPAVSLNAALASVAGTLHGRGDQLGRVLVELDGYLHGFNPSLPDLAADLPPGAAVADLLAEATPPLVDTARDGGAVTATLAERRTDLAALLTGLRVVGRDGAGLLRENRDGLRETVVHGDPVTGLLARYSPELPCLLAGLTRNAAILRPTTGGRDFGGATRNAHLLLTFGAAREGYRYPQDRPRIAETGPPSCYGLPVVGGVVPLERFDTGSTPLPGHRDGVGPGRRPVGLTAPALPAGPR